MENNKQIKNIFLKWEEEHRHGHFLCFKDNDESNDSTDNLEYVPFNEALKKRLTCNWTWGLNDKEIDYVKQDWTQFINY